MSPLLTKQIDLWHKRPFSWSQYSSWEYDPQQWYQRYILGESTPETPALKFGKRFAESIEWGEPMAPILLLPTIEYKVEATLDSLPLLGFMDSWCPTTLHIAEYKTGEKKWDDARVASHGQLTYYALLLYLAHQIVPKDLKMTLQWLPTTTRSDGTFGFTDPAVIHTFETSRTMRDVLELAADIKKTRKEMEEYIAKRS